MSKAMKCVKCGGEMEPGLLGDSISKGTVTINSHWISHPDPENIERHRWSGGIKVDQSDPVMGYRCKSCGYLELYAPRIE